MDAATIAAVATPAGSGGIGIVKISGGHAFDIAENIFRRRGEPLSSFQSHRLYHGQIVDPGNGRIIDEVLLGAMRAPGTYTREDIVEINAHAGSVVLHAILELVLKNGARLAEPGEFTQRAFLNGRIDLTQAEAVIDIISAKTERSLQSAAAQLSGEMRRRVMCMREALIGLLAEAEALVDFHDDEPIAFSPDRAANTVRSHVIEPLEELLRQYRSGRAFREGVRMIIIGRPNVGKSSLMNRLLEKDRVIVAPVPGTTRDLVEDMLNIGGVPVTIADSAGLHQSDDPLEKISMEKTISHIDGCDLVLMMVDAPGGVMDSDMDIVEKIQEKRPLLVVNKIDLMDEKRCIPSHKSVRFSSCVQISAKYGQGIDHLKAAILDTVADAELLDWDHAIIPNLRQKTAMERALEFARSAESQMMDEVQMERVSMDIKDAIKALGQIVGETEVPDLFDQIFSRFCVGK